MEGFTSLYNNGPLAISIDAKPAYEFLASLRVFSSFDRHTGYEVGREWFEAIKARAPQELLRQLTIFKFKDTWLHSQGLVYDCPLPRDVSTFISYCDSLDARELRLRFLGYYRRDFRRTTPPEVIRKAVEGDVTAQRQFARTAYADEPAEQKALLQVLALSPEEMKQSLLAVMRQWYEEVYRDQEEQIMTIISRDAANMRTLKQTIAPERLLELVSNGYEYIPEPFIRDIVLIPTFVGRPYICDIDHHDHMLFSYSVADESLVADASMPSGRLVRLYKALADERRLRILKKLTTGSYTLQEIADDFGAGKSTLHYHMVTLRSAGLVRINSRDRRYSLRRDAIPSASEWLAAYLQTEKM